VVFFGDRSRRRSIDRSIDRSTHRRIEASIATRDRSIASRVRPRARPSARAAGARECATPGHVLRDQWGGAGAPGGDAERRAVREIVDREGDRGARANRGRGEGDGRTRAAIAANGARMRREL
jgi:hypothetical protein